MAGGAAKVSACVGGSLPRSGTKMENRKTRFARRGARLRQPVLAPASRIKKTKANFGLAWDPALEKASSTGRTPPNPDTTVSPRARDVPRRLADLDPETAKLTEDVTIDSKGRLIPKLYSKTWANAELRKMLGRKEPEPDNVSKLSDSELLSQLAQQAKELGIKIDLNYTFAKQPFTTEMDVIETVTETDGSE